MALSNKQPCHSDALLALYYSCFYDCFPDTARIRLTCSSQVSLREQDVGQNLLGHQEALVASLARMFSLHLQKLTGTIQNSCKSFEMHCCLAEVRENGTGGQTAFCVYPYTINVLMYPVFDLLSVNNQAGLMSSFQHEPCS